MAASVGSLGDETSIDTTQGTAESLLLNWEALGRDSADGENVAEARSLGVS